MSVIEHPTARTYFNVTRAEDGEVFLHVEHRVGEYVEALLVPIEPHNAVEVMAELVEPEFAHYLRQWERVMPPGDEPGSVWFFVPTRTLPAHIAGESHRQAIADALWDHSSDAYKSWWGDARPVGLAIWPSGVLVSGTVDKMASAADVGVDAHSR